MNQLLKTVLYGVGFALSLLSGMVIDTYYQSRSKDLIYYAPVNTINYIVPGETVETVTEELYVKYVSSRSILNDSMARTVVRGSLKYGRSPALLLAIFRKESTFNPMEIGTKTKYGYARGLGQVMFSLWKTELRRLGIHQPKQLFDIHKNIRASEFIIRTIAKRENGDIYRILKGYYGAHEKSYQLKIIKYYFDLKALEDKAKVIIKTQRARGIHGYTYR
jgi:hypothetical protein